MDEAICADIDNSCDLKVARNVLNKPHFDMSRVL